jgi:hypothetical protein
MYIPLNKVAYEEENKARACGNSDIEKSWIDINSNPNMWSVSLINCSITLDSAIRRIKLSKKNWKKDKINRAKNLCVKSLVLAPRKYNFK